MDDPRPGGAAQITEDNFYIYIEGGHTVTKWLSVTQLAKPLWKSSKIQALIVGNEERHTIFQSLMERVQSHLRDSSPPASPATSL